MGAVSNRCLSCGTEGLELHRNGPSPWLFDRRLPYGERVPTNPEANWSRLVLPSCRLGFGQDRLFRC